MCSDDVPERVDARLQLGHADVVQVGAHFGRVDGRVEDVARLAARAAHEHVAHAFRGVLRGRARTLRRFVVGVRVHLEQAELVSFRHGRAA